MMGQKLVEKKVEKNILLKLLVIIAGITLNMPLPYFKYIFLICAIALMGIVAFDMIKGKQIYNFICDNKAFAFLGMFTFVLVTAKHIIAILCYENNMSLITGYGEVIVILFGLLFFNYFSQNVIRLLLSSYVVTFAAAFVIFGKYTLYDYGNVCRTIGAYQNPNTLSLYGGISFCFSLVLLQNAKQKIKYLYVVIASISLASIINTTSRAMYLGITASFLIVIVMTMIKKMATLNEWKSGLEKNIRCICVFFIILIGCIIIYYPKVENAIIDGTKGELALLIGEEGVEGESFLGDNIFNRVMSDKNLSTGASVKNNTRFDIWKEYFKHLNEYILWGNDRGNDAMFFPDYGRDYVPHNIFISIMYKYGIVGTVLFMCVIVKPICLLYKRKKVETNQCIIFGGMCMLIIFGMLHEATSTGIFWAEIGMFHNALDGSDS